MGCVLYPPGYLVAPLHRAQRRRPTRAIQHPPPLCISTARVSSWRWPVLSQSVNTTPVLPTEPTERDSPTARTTTTTVTTTNEKTIHHHNSYYQKNRPVTTRKDRIMEQRLIALPSIALSISVLALGAVVGSGSCHSPPASHALSAVLSRFIGLGFGLNLSTLAPILTLAWHAFSLLSRSSAHGYTHAHASVADSHDYYQPLSDSSSAVAGDNHHPSTATMRTRARVWVPHGLAFLWALNTLLVLIVPRWSLSIAFSYVGLAILSALEASVLALGGMFARCQIQRELAGETDDDGCWWETDDVVDGDDRKRGEISPA